MALTDLSGIGLDDETLELPIHGETYAFKAVGARFGRAFRKAATSGVMDRELLPDDPNSDEYRHLFGDQYATMLDLLSDPEWQHVTNTLAAWILGGRTYAEQVWERAVPERTAPAAGSSAGARSTKTASTSGTSTAKATSRRPAKKAAARASGGRTSSSTKT
ncbi:DUF7426 family protein [Yinghuangia soli]|uniref:DUF7426 domain-containing protein n=1 Tax=Yinghuangia soli TaxID=2908204 RepID=A0AA41U5C0_9ACTN|nr:hypothetical protein [Yinghuangia soli]MCF2531752.1 hypothetical protein [Yinghuangia soli]